MLPALNCQPISRASITQYLWTLDNTALLSLTLETRAFFNFALLPLGTIEAFWGKCQLNLVSKHVVNKVLELSFPCLCIFQQKWYGTLPVFEPEDLAVTGSELATAHQSMSRNGGKCSKQTDCGFRLWWIAKALDFAFWYYGIFTFWKRNIFIPIQRLLMLGST